MKMGVDRTTTKFTNLKADSRKEEQLSQKGLLRQVLDTWTYRASWLCLIRAFEVGLLVHKKKILKKGKSADLYLFLFMKAIKHAYRDILMKSVEPWLERGVPLGYSSPHLIAINIRSNL